MVSATYGYDGRRKVKYTRRKSIERSAGPMDDPSVIVGSAEEEEEEGEKGEGGGRMAAFVFLVEPTHWSLVCIFFWWLTTDRTIGYGVRHGFDHIRPSQSGGTADEGCTGRE